LRSGGMHQAPANLKHVSVGSGDVSAPVSSGVLMSQVKQVSLETMDDGAVIERFDYELARVLANIADINTKAEVERSVTLTVKIKPNEARDHTVVTYDVKSKMAGIKPETTTFYLVERDGQTVAVEHNPKQERFAFQETT